MKKKYPAWYLPNSILYRVLTVFVDPDRPGKGVIGVTELSFVLGVSPSTFVMFKQQFDLPEIVRRIARWTRRNESCGTQLVV